MGACKSKEIPITHGPLHHITSSEFLPGFFLWVCQICESASHASHRASHASRASHGSHSFSSIGLGGRRSFHKQTNLNLATKELHENSLNSLRLPELLLLGQILNVGETS